MFHLRYTPYDISGYTFDFIDSFSSHYIVAQEDLEDDGTPLLHYHILIDTDYGSKSIRDAAKKFLKIPEAGRGRNNKYYALIEDWKDPSYICKYYNVIRSKGFTEKQVLDYAIEGKQKYLDKKSTTPEVMKIEIVKKKVQSVDKQLSAALYAWYMCDNEKHLPPNKQQIIRKICELYRGYEKGVNKYKVRDAYHTLMWDVNGPDRDELVDDIIKML